MALGRSRRSARGFDYWPGFVDALSVMLLTMIFLLSVFMLAQFFLSRDISGKDNALAKLNRQIDELTSLLALERAGRGDAQSSIAMLSASLDAANAEKQRLEGVIASNGAAVSAAAGQAAEAARALDAEKQLSARASAQVDIPDDAVAVGSAQALGKEDHGQNAL